MEKMTRLIAICIFLVLMDIAAGMLGIGAQVSQDNCREANYEAYKLGLAASVLIAAAHVIANVLVGCVCIRSKAEFGKASSYRQQAAVSLGLSWIILCVAFSMLVIETVSSARSRDTCEISIQHSHRFVIGGILCFLHGLFLVIYYVSAAATTVDEAARSQLRRASRLPLPA